MGHWQESALYLGGDSNFVVEEGCCARRAVEPRGLCRKVITSGELDQEAIEIVDATFVDDFPI
jgi:hypothetical protein